METQSYTKLAQAPVVDDTANFLAVDSDILKELYTEKKLRKNLERQNRVQWIVFLIIVLFTTLGVLSLTVSDRRIKIPTDVYSPVQHLVTYKTVVFDSGFVDNKSPFSGYPSETNNKLWEDSYNYGIVKIPRSEAERLVNHTVPLPTDPNYYILGFDVFHQLHCLNDLRKIAWGGMDSMGVDMRNNAEKGSFYEHMDHCIDSLRQSLMCSADIAPIHWTWNDRNQKVQPASRTVHTCRDFEAIRTWAFENRVGVFNGSIHVPDPLLS